MSDGCEVSAPPALRLDDAMGDLQQRAVRCHHWRWLPGMRSLSGRRVAWVAGDPTYPLPGGIRDGDERVRPDNCVLLSTEYSSEDLPDFFDAATRGCLLHLVREAWGDPEAYVRTAPCGRLRVVWDVYVWQNNHGASGRQPVSFRDGTHGCATEAEALIRALELAP